VFLGELIIGKQELTQPELLPLGAAENSTPSTPAQGTLKFGTMG
jgi:hypothetical protein